MGKWKNRNTKYENWLVKCEIGTRFVVCEKTLWNNEQNEYYVEIVT